MSGSGYDPIDTARAELAAAESRLTGARLNLEMIYTRNKRSMTGMFADTVYVPRWRMEQKLRDLEAENSKALKPALAKAGDPDDQDDTRNRDDDRDKGDDLRPSPTTRAASERKKPRRPNQTTASPPKTSAMITRHPTKTSRMPRPRPGFAPAVALAVTRPILNRPPARSWWLARSAWTAPLA